MSDDTLQRGNDVRRMSFDDNALLQTLVGQHDRNLVRIEQLLGVRIDSRGNQLAIAGASEAVAQAGAAIGALYERLRRGQTGEGGDVDAAVRGAQSGGAAQPGE
ncbi:MAG: phosphate starvation-inducible protein PhoH, partial [Reyranellaceae bacterium]